MTLKENIISSVRLSLRSLVQNKIYSIINVLGLSIGIASFLFIMSFVTYESSYDSFLKDSQKTYRVAYSVYRNGEENIESAASVPRIGPFMKEVMPEVTDFGRLFPFEGNVRFRDNSFRETRIFYADPSILDLFSVSMLLGESKSALSSPDGVVISASRAKAYFGEEDPIGKTLILNGSDNLIITGVMQDLPENSHLHFDLLVSYATLNGQTRRENGQSRSEIDWGWYAFYTYIQLKEETDLKDFDDRLAEVIQAELGDVFEQYGYVQKFTLQPVTSIHLDSSLSKELEPQSQGDLQSIRLLTIISFVILVIAWANHINISTVRAYERSKEVRIRKVTGANRRGLFLGFLLEAFVINGISLLVGVLLFASSFSATEILKASFLFNEFTAVQIGLLLIAILIVSTLISGLYPALIASAFSPNDRVNHQPAIKKLKINFRHGLILLQIIFSITFVGSTIVIYQQFNLVNTEDLGFNQEDLFVIHAPKTAQDRESFGNSAQTLKGELKSISSIRNVAISTNIPGNTIVWARGIKRQGETPDKFKTIHQLGVGYDYFDTYDMAILAGKNYRKDFNDQSSLVINYSAINFLGFRSAKSAINQQVEIGRNTYKVIGVVQDHHQLSFKTQIMPMVFPLAPSIGRYFTVRHEPGQYSSSLKSTKESFAEIFPESPFETFILKDNFRSQYQKEENFGKVFLVFSVIAIIIASFGLYGLSYYTTLKRTREIGIRKSIGASPVNIIKILLGEYALLTLLGSALAFPLTYVYLTHWLDNFSIRVDIGMEVFLSSLIIVALISLLTVSFQTLKAVNINPVKTLRNE